MKISIISTNQESFPLVAIPNGPAYLAAVLLKQDHQVEIIDLLFADDIEKTVVAHLDKFGPELIGVSLRQTDNNELFGFRSYLENAKTVVETIKKHSKADIIVGGSAFTLFPSELLQYLELCHGISGDGEVALPSFVQYIEGKNKLDDIPGICYRTDVKIVVKPPAKIHDLDALPFPAYELLDLQKYMAVAPGLTIQGKRGCDMVCTFCPDGSDKEGCRLRTPKSIVDEMQFMINKHNINRFHFTDGLFNYPVDHALAVCNEIINRKLKVGWMGGINPVGITHEFVTAMKISGCRYISLGIDTASEKMLKNYRKGFNKADIVTTANWLSEAGIRFDYSILFGGPGEDMDTVQETLDFVHGVSQQVVFRVGIRIFPGTELEQQAIADGTIKSGQNLMLPVFYLSKALPADFARWLDDEADRHTNWLTIYKMLNKNPPSR